MRGHIDVTPFRSIVADWLAEREQSEACTCSCRKLNDGCFHYLPKEQQAQERADSFCEKIELVIWQLRQQKKDVNVLKEAVIFFMLNVMPKLESVPNVESALYNLIEDYLQGQGYQTRSC